LLLSCFSDLLIYIMLGLCYDGAASMRGAKRELKSRILGLNHKALYVHCFGHSLNLVVHN